MERLNEILDIVNIKYESGATSIGDLSNIKANVSNAESKLIRIESKFNEALEYYKYIVGDDFTKTFPYEDNFDTNVDDFNMIVEKAVQNNMNLKNYKLNIEAEKYELLKSKSGFKPKVDLELSSERITDQEDFTDVERNYKAQVTLSYNFYNKGKDKNAVLTVHSKIRELDYRLKEEIRKLKWKLSKLHTSILSVTNASVSTEKEVSASQEMVSAYWDGFKLGEQDLQELLQGQQQLNSAQLDLISNKKSAVTDYFKLLSNTGELLKYFRLDIDKDNFIDFSRSDYKNLLKTKDDDILSSDLEKNANDLNTTAIMDNNITKDDLVDSNATIALDNNVSQNTDINTTIKTDDINTTTIVNNSLNDLLAFEKRFLETKDDNWTIRIYYFDKVYQALDFGNENKISKDIFIFDTLDKNKVKTNIAYNIFDTKQLAQKSLDDLNITSKNTKVSPIKDIKKIYSSFKNKKLQTKVKVKKVKPFRTNPLFKKRFLEANIDFYTINITSFSSILKAKELLEKEKIYKNSFVFSYGEEKEWVKVVYGVFETYEEASSALEKLKNIKEKYEPVIEVISSKQELYKKYNKSVHINENLIIEEELKQTNEHLDSNKTISTIDDKFIFEFKDRFLDAREHYYTLNLATIYDEDLVEEFHKNNSDALDIFIFKFGQDTTMYKAMGGVYETYEQAKIALEELPQKLQRNKPRIEKIKTKQQLYLKYNTQEEN